jgi:hypothetical protein
MEIKLKKIDEKDSELWDSMVGSSSYGTLFHTWKFLKIVEKYTNSELFPMMAYRGTVIVGIYPIFLKKKGFINLAFSPPPRACLMYLGPLIFDENLKQNKKENIYIELLREINRFLFSELKCKYVKIESSPGLFDCRPFEWFGYQVIPRYTYRINLTKGADYVWRQFDRKLRVDLNRANRGGILVKEGNEEDIEFVYNLLYMRCREQGGELKVDKRYLLELYKEFNSKNNLKVLTAYYKGEKIGGAVYLVDENVIYLLAGLTKTNLKGISINDMIQWYAIKWACNNGVSYYDSMDGGGKPRLVPFKSKYNPELVQFFTVTKCSYYTFRLLEMIYMHLG